SREGRSQVEDEQHPETPPPVAFGSLLPQQGILVRRVPAQAQKAVRAYLRGGYFSVPAPRGIEQLEAIQAVPTAHDVIDRGRNRRDLIGVPIFVLSRTCEDCG